MNGWQLWGEQYHTPIADVLTVQQELTAAISESIPTTPHVEGACALTADPNVSNKRTERI